MNCPNEDNNARFWTIPPRHSPGCTGFADKRRASQTPGQSMCKVSSLLDCPFQKVTNTAHPILMSERSGWKRFQTLFLVQLAYWLILLHQEGHLSWSDIFNIHHHCTPPIVCWNNGDICILIKLLQGSCVVTGVGCGLQWFRFGQSFLSQGCSAEWFCAADQLGPNGMDSDLRSWLVQNQTYIH